MASLTDDARATMGDMDADREREVSEETGIDDGGKELENHRQTVAGNHQPIHNHNTRRGTV